MAFVWLITVRQIHESQRSLICFASLHYMLTLPTELLTKGQSLAAPCTRAQGRRSACVGAWQQFQSMFPLSSSMGPGETAAPKWLMLTLSPHQLIGEGSRHSSPLRSVAVPPHACLRGPGPFVMGPHLPQSKAELESYMKYWLVKNLMEIFFTYHIRIPWTAAAKSRKKSQDR